MTFLSKTF